MLCVFYMLFYMLVEVNGKKWNNILYLNISWKIKINNINKCDKVYLFKWKCLIIVLKGNGFCFDYII